VRRARITRAVVPLMPPLTELPEAVQALRSEKERAFVWHYMWNGGNGAQAARDAGYSDVKGGAKVRGFEVLLRDDVLEALRALGTRYLYSLQPLALIKLREHLVSDNEKISQKAVDMTLSRTGLSERTAVDVNVHGSVQVNHVDAAVEDLRRLKALGVPHEKLVETFGFSGLSRYEKLLAASEAAKAVPAIIEGEVSSP